MPERKDSVDSFDDFFGASNTYDNHKRSSNKPEKDDPSLSMIVKKDSLIEKSQTPTTPEEPKFSLSKTKPKISNAKTSSKTNGHKNISPEMSNRTESIQSKTYESDFDDNDFDDNETTSESIHERKKTHDSFPPSKQPKSKIPRRGSDSELKNSYTTAQYNKKTNRNIQRKEYHLPYIRPARTRQINNLIRHQKETISATTKNETELRELSAQNDKIKSLESRLAELRRELETQRIENTTLRTIQRREEKAIKKYEEKEYDIHRMVYDYTHQIDHIKRVLSHEREAKLKLEKQIEVREEKLREQTKRLKKYEKLIKEKKLDERYELHNKLNEADKKLQEIENKLVNQDKYIENLEKNHRHEIKQELVKQRNLKQQLETGSQKYNDLLLKFEDKTRQIDTMHIYAQRDDTSSRSREKSYDYNKKQHEQQERERRFKSQQKRSSSNESSLMHEKRKIMSKKESQHLMAITKTTSDNEKTILNDHLPPKRKSLARRLSSPKSIDEEKSDIFGSRPSRLLPPTTIHRSEQHLSHAQLHKRPGAPIPTANESKYNSSAAGTGTSTSSIFRLTEPPMPSKSRATRQLDDKWSEMFGTNEKEDSTKEDLLAKLVADEQQERRLAAAAQSSSTQRQSMTMFESSKPATTTTQSTTTKAAADPLESLFNNAPNKPVINRESDQDDIFSTKPSAQPKAQARNDSFESLFGPSSINDNSTSAYSNSRQYASQNDKLQRPKLVTNVAKPTSNRTVVDELEDFS